MRMFSEVFMTRSGGSELCLNQPFPVNLNQMVEREREQTI